MGEQTEHNDELSKEGEILEPEQTEHNEDLPMEEEMLEPEQTEHSEDLPMQDEMLDPEQTEQNGDLSTEDAAAVFLRDMLTLLECSLKERGKAPDDTEWQIQIWEFIEEIESALLEKIEDLGSLAEAITH